AVYVAAEADADRAAVVFEERLEVADRLGAHEDAEGVRLVRNLHVAGGTAGELEEDAAGGPSFVQLAGRVEEAWAVAGGGGDVELVRDGLANLCDPLIPFLCLAEILSQCDVVARLDLGEERRD